MNTNDPKHNGSVEKAHERAHADVKTDAEANGAAFGQMEAERKDSSQVQAEAREAGEAQSAAEEHGEDKARANAEQTQGNPDDDADDDADTEKRTDTLASEATTDTPEARRNEAGPTDNISEHGAYGDADEVDEIAGPPMPSKSPDMVEEEKA